MLVVREHIDTRVFEVAALRGLNSKFLSASVVCARKSDVLVVNESSTHLAHRPSNFSPMALRKKDESFVVGFSLKSLSDAYDVYVTSDHQRHTVRKVALTASKHGLPATRSLFQG
jgi:siroheme synthase (precorrin-2 oxidase/ferrochelatase)